MDGGERNVRRLETQAKGLTTDLSLRGSPSAIPSSSASSEVDQLLGRLHEMEERQQRMEGLLGGAGDSSTELEEVRSKRLQLEERQLLLENELKQWKRRLKDIDSEPAPGSSKKGKYIVKERCTRCTDWKEQKERIDDLEQKLDQKEDELMMERVFVESAKSWLEREKRDLEESRDELIEEDKRLQILRIEEEKKKKLNQACSRCDKIPKIEEMEETLCRKLNELAVENAKVDGEKAWIDCVKQDLEAFRIELREQQNAIQTAKLEIENQKKVIDREKQKIYSVSSANIGATSSSNVSASDWESLKQRELMLTKKAQELYEFKSKLEKKQQELAAGRDELEQQWEQLLVVQKTLETQKTQLEKDKNELSQMKSLSDWERELEMERDKLALEKNEVMKQKALLNQRQLDIETNFNLLEMQTQAISEMQHSFVDGRNGIRLGRADRQT